MTKDEVIRMAREAGLFYDGPKELEKFAALVAAAEREACAKVCEDDAWRCKKIAVDTQNKQANAAAIEAIICADAIRARKP